ncbi:cell division protein FtsQ/DivIB [Sphingomonas sp. SUN039]|uniref:cell division protein FtsQ/DivIB n=1 Tax=Sphingomonas sp. SUN039 TaxID=2937787 RepID=UPI0021648EEA|nr:cell division protein FtsQ/DivIB [Sphingomonas sp. SUN039]UVO54467.1 FtsQ-type POTRA domain-containing protein [Sphingomonas sp. SUN039]
MSGNAPIKRGAATKRKPVKVVKSGKRKPSLFARLVAQVPLSARTVERATTAIVLTVAAGGISAIAMMLDVPHKVGMAAGDAVGRAGFSVKHIDIVGADRMDRTSVYAVALDQLSLSMPLVDLEGVRQKLLKYGWVADARVSRRLPDTLAIEIVERKPAAVWQHAQQLTLVDAKGVPLEQVSLNAMPNLPLVIGPDANVQATALTALMNHAPQLKPVLDGAMWIGDRRWDLKFQSGETLLLPEGEAAAAAALRKFAELDGAQRLLGRGMARFDMRNPDQMAVLPGAKKATAATESRAGDKPAKIGPIDPARTT